MPYKHPLRPKATMKSTFCSKYVSDNIGSSFLKWFLLKLACRRCFLKKLGYLVNSKATFHLWSKKQDKHCSMILKIIEKVSFNIVNEASYQTGHFWCDKNWWKIPKLGNTNATIWVIFKQCAYPQAMILHDKYNPNFCGNIFNRIFFRLQFILRAITNFFWETFG